MSDLVSHGLSNMLGMKIVQERNKHQLRYPQRIEPEEVFALTYDFGSNAKPTGEYFLPDDRLDPRYNYDFTKEKDDGKVYMRGAHRYYRPYGWRRIALKVKGRYENDIWLGEDGMRTATTPGEWPVSYHGTNRDGIKGIVKEGYQDKCIKQQAYGRGHYSSPSIEVAEGYAHIFKFGDRSYKVVLQNRVDPSRTETHHYGGKYWLTKEQSALRPYGILFKLLK